MVHRISPLAAIASALFPSSCACCGEVLMEGERQICLHCLSDLRETLYFPIPDNPVERLLYDRIPLMAAGSAYRFLQGTTVQHTIHAMKFHSNPELCILMGRQMGLCLRRSGRFDDIDLLVPVPLHWRRRLRRGYNQSELLCRGIAQITNTPVCTHAVSRPRHTRQQSLQQSSNRTVNVDGAFRLRNGDLLAGKHILLVDDVLTTGATLTACADTLASVPDLRISVATLASVV